MIGLAAGQAVAAAQPAGQEIAAPTIEQRLLADAADGTLDEFNLLQAALITDGIYDYAARQRAVDQFGEICLLLASEMRPQESSEQRAADVFRLMHKYVLTGQYQSPANSVAHTLSTGEYNCLSAAILYQCLCDHFQIPVVPVALPGHVRSRFAEEHTFEIEPTCPQWFDARSGRQRFETGTQITPVQLIARVYYNRATEHLENREFASAIDLLHICTKLDPEHTAARTNLLAAINNWVLALCEIQEFSAASRRLSKGLALAPDHEPFLANDLYVHGHWVRVLCERGEYQHALAVLEAAHRRRPDVAMFDRGRTLIVDAWETARSKNQRGHDVATSE